MAEMATRQNNADCAPPCGGIAAVVAVVAMGVLYGLAGVGVLQASFGAGFFGNALGAVLFVLICRVLMATVGPGPSAASLGRRTEGASAADSGRGWRDRILACEDEMLLAGVPMRDGQ